MTMTTDRHAVTTDEDLPVTDAVRRAVATLLTADSDPLDAVGWASAHLAAVERTLLPAADRVGERETAAGLRRLGHRLQHELRRLEQTSSGDALMARTDAVALRRLVIDLLDELGVAETALFTRVFEVLGPDGTRTVLAAYRHALAVAPTRPHPYAPHRGVLGAVAFRVEALRDRILNTMDGRSVPVERPRRAVPEPGRWSQYLLGDPRPTVR
jgi:hypothetical protein